jgi:hypothetical protein
MDMLRSACVLEVNKDFEVYVSSFTKVIMQLRNADVKTPIEEKTKCSVNVFPFNWASYSYQTTMSRYPLRLFLKSISTELGPS